ncbi:MAG: hypothetical protein K6T86_06455 [Pirellulales bacterium]|nr:hypothetical protein [Pirellulales bacterium]
MSNPSEPQAASGDPLGCRADLAEALAAPALSQWEGSTPPSAEVPLAAYQVAVALGRCRLFGVDPGELDGTLPPDMALAAACQLACYLSEWTHVDVPTLPQRWEDAADPAEAEEMCLELLEARMEAWAAFVAIDEAYAATLVAGDAPPHPETAARLAHELDGLPARLDAFDHALAEQIPLLATAADTQLLNNWRALLAPPYRELLPWWLDGTLERAAQQAYQQMLAELPRSSTAAIPLPAPPPHRPSPALVAYRQALASAPSLAARVADRPATTLLGWNAPDGRFTAYLPLSTEPRTDFTLSFFAITGEPATQLAGTQVELDGVEGVINDQGQTLLSSERLRSAPRHDAILLVGPQRIAWTLIDD